MTDTMISQNIDLSSWDTLYICVLSRLNGLDFVVEKNFVGFEVLTAVVMRSSIFWNITPCSPLKVNRRFGGIFRLHLWGSRKQREALTMLFLPPALLWFLA
jgi:hypothetical protein